ncbi:MAG: reductive dehalogenase [Deltaproteobacteria bacterium]|nr:reductive dehalogenase [Deltaproteobacteria bacterium]
MMLLYALLAIVLVSLAAMLLFTVSSIREQEPRAPKVGVAGFIFLLIIGWIILIVPGSRIFFAVVFAAIILFGLLFLIPGKSRARSLQGAMGYAEEDVRRFDERDVVFSRNRAIPPGSENYRAYYKMHPEREEYDARRRAVGGTLGKMGAIDKQYRPNVEMIKISPQMGGALESHSAGFQMSEEAKRHLSFEPDKVSAEEIEPAKASEIIKGYARLLGADVVGICEVNSNWAYSHKGYAGWGDEVPEPLPYAVVFATEMRHQYVISSPHTSAEVECAFNYAKGTFISTALAQWFVGMGYRAKANNNRTYEMIMPPLAVDAGLGELGRCGYVITDKLGPRARIFACTTDMPLVPDKPVDLGAEEFCERCRKCAQSCPSRSIPEGDMVVFNGIRKWKLNDETCFDYWGKVGTGCSICMAICPYSRPNKGIHRLVRWLLKRSPLARKVFPHVDNIVYGTKWHPRPPPSWVRPPGGRWEKKGNGYEFP